MADRLEPGRGLWSALPYGPDGSARGRARPVDLEGGDLAIAALAGERYLMAQRAPFPDNASSSSASTPAPRISGW